MNLLVVARYLIGMTPYFQRDGVQLFHGDCLELLPTLAPGSVDAVVTDPPYGIQGGSGGDARDFGKGRYKSHFEDNEKYVSEVVIPSIRSCLSLDVPMAVTPGIRCLHLYPRAADIGCFWTPANQTHGPWGFTTFHPILYYGKDWRAGRGAMPSGRTVTEAARKNGHPCPKPIQAWKWLVDKTCLFGGRIFDPYTGSGTTGVACIRTGRKFIGCEIEERYCEIAAKRLEAALHKGPIREFEWDESHD